MSTSQATPLQLNLEAFGKVFAPLSLDDEATYGYYQDAGNGKTRLYDRNKVVKALVLNNLVQGTFVVTASQTTEGIRYMFSTCTHTEIWLGIENDGHWQLQDRIEAMKFIPRADH